MLVAGTHRDEQDRDRKRWCCATKTALVPTPGHTHKNHGSSVYFTSGVSVIIVYSTGKAGAYLCGAPGSIAKVWCPSLKANKWLIWYLPGSDTK